MEITWTQHLMTMGSVLAVCLLVFGYALWVAKQPVDPEPKKLAPDDPPAKPLSTRILSPDEAAGDYWIAVVEERWIRAIDRDHAERIIEVCKMCAAMGHRRALYDVRSALGLTSFGSSVSVKEP